MKYRSIGSLLVAAVLSFAGHAAAKDIPAAGITAPEVVDWLATRGYQAKIKENPNARQYIDVSIGGDVKWQIYLYDCKDERCGSLQFAAGYDTKGKATPEKINDWNKHNRWCRAYSDDVNDPWIEYDVDLTPGGSYELLNDELAIWLKMDGLFAKDYGY